MRRSEPPVRGYASSAAATGFTGHSPWLSLLALTALVLLAYANALGGVFQFDDFNVIVDLHAVHSLDAWWADAGQGIRPLLKLSYTLNWISGWGPAGFIATNVLLHVAAGWLVFRLSQVFLDAQGVFTQMPLVAWFAAALFALHPANTEAVSYICGRSTSLMALLYLLGLWAHTQAARTGWRARLLAALCFAMALGVKETAVSFPLALLLWDLATGTRCRAALQKAWPSWMVLVAAAVGFWLNDAYHAAMERSLEFNTLAGNAATQLGALLYLARQWALPLWLNIDPDLAVQMDFSQALAALAFFLLVLAALLRTWHRRPWMGFGLAWALLHWLPLYLVLPRLDVANDRQLYLAIWPVGLALVVELQRAVARRAMHALLGMLLLAGMALTVQRNQDYRSEVALWEQTVALSPGKSRVHNNLGYAYRSVGRVGEARQAYLQALRLDPGNVKARLNLRRMNAELAIHAAP